MPIAKHDAVIAAIVAKLKEAPAIAGGQVDDETDFDELPETATQAVRVTLLDSLPTSAYGVVQWTSTVRVACMARHDRVGAGGADGRPSMQVAAAVYARLMADQTLGSVVKRIDEPRLQPDMNFYRDRIGVHNLDFPVKHETTGRVLT
jgi:hypothetical protein